LLTHPKVRGRGLPTAALAACIALVVIVAPRAGAPEPAAAPTEAEAGDASATASVVSTKRVVPRRRKLVRHRFQPWSRPSPRKVRQIIRIEARRWRIDPARLARRVACESNFQWAANGGAYFGLLQFAPSTFTRGLGSIRTRRVAIVRKRVRRPRAVTISRYSDGRVVRERGRRHRQVVVHVHAGRLPRRPGLTHGWAQLRIGAQAIRGISAVSSSEWGCPA
jgi:hypothetical protein